MKFFKPFKLPSVPVFPYKVFDIRDYGAEEGGKKAITAALKSAIADCSAQGGGRVLVPAGHWLTGPIHLLDNVELHFAKGAFVEFSTRFHDYLPVVYGILGGVRVYSVSHFLYAYKCKNIAITGEGILDGHGEVWDHMKQHQPGMEDLLRKGRARAPLSERVYDKPEDGVRPHMLQFVECEDILIENITLKNSPSWNVHLAWCKNFTVRGICVESPYESHNTDGTDFEYCERGLMENCTISGGDDMCCIKAGREADAWEYGVPCRDIEIRNCRAINCRSGGITVGSETSASIRNIYIHDCHLEKVNRGIFIKTMKGRGGVVENIDIENIEVEQAGKEAISISMRYAGEPLDDQTQPDAYIPKVRNLYINNFSCRNSHRSMEVCGIKGHEMENIIISNSTIHSDGDCHVENARLFMENVSLLENQ